MGKRRRLNPKKDAKMPDEEEQETEYDTGPFCIHWSDPADCEEICATCKHWCRAHGLGECNEGGCKCVKFKDQDDSSEPKESK